MPIRAISLVGFFAACTLIIGAVPAQAKHHHHHKASCTHAACCSKTHCCEHKGSHDAGAVLWKKGNCKTELELMKKAGMCHVLCGKGPLTVFAPTDAAYAKLGKARLDDLQNDPKKLLAAMKYHIVGRKVTSADIQAKGALTTLEAESLMTNVKDGRAEVDGCLLSEPDNAASNGVVHFIDDVPLPERGK